MIPAAKAAVIETMAGFFRGKTGFLVLEDVDPDRRAEDDQDHRQEGSHQDRRHCCRVVNFFQRIDMSSAGKFALAGDGERQADHEGHVLALEEDAEEDGDDAEDHGRHPGDVELLLVGGLPLLYHAWCRCRAQLRRPRQGQTGDHREDGGEGHGGDEAEEGRPASSSARSGAAMLPPLSTEVITSRPTSAAAPKPTMGMMM